MLAENNDDPEAMEREWNEKFQAFEDREGNFSPNEIEGWVREINHTHAATHKNKLPALGSDVAKRIEAKALDMKISSLNQSLIEFEEKYGASAPVVFRPGCAEIEDEVVKLRQLVTDMKLNDLLAIEFRNNINRHATGGLLASNVPEDMVPMLLGIGKYKSEAASLTAALDLK